MPFDVFSINIFRWSLNDNLSSKISPKCFCAFTFLTFIPLKFRSGWFTTILFLENKTSWACLEMFGLNDIFHWCAQRFICSKSLFNVSAEVLGSNTAENKDVSSANNFTSDLRFSEMSLI